MKSLITLPIAALLAVACFAQDNFFGTLPFVSKPGASQFPGISLDGSPEHARALAVYKRLLQAKGDFRHPLPGFALRREERRVAGIDYEYPEIVLEEKAYQVCASFGPDADAAIAWLLSHELTHYFEKHAWRRGIATDHAAHEAEAEYLGGFLMFSAGYGVFTQGGELIERLYKAYGLPFNLKGYPTLEERKKQAARSAEKLLSMVDAWQMANMLAAIGKYAEAYEYYQYLLMQYQSRELYYQLGLMAMLEALQQGRETGPKFRYPLEPGLAPAVAGGTGKWGASDEALHYAIHHFDAVISLDPGYAPAYLGKAVAFEMLGEHARARFYAVAEAQQAAANTREYAQTGLDAAVLIGIIDYREGNILKAENAFREAAAKGAAWGAHNLKVLYNDTREFPSNIAGADAALERIDDQAMRGIAQGVRFDPKMAQNISGQIIFNQNPQQGRQSRLLISHDKRRSRQVLIHLANKDYAGKTLKGIARGARREAVVKEYGEPIRTMQTSYGEIMTYASMLFFIDAGGKVERWAVYAM
jgi:hypothetical protein